MKNWILAAVIGLATCGQAWAWDDDDYPIGGLRDMDEITVSSPPIQPGPNATREDVRDYFRDRDEFSAAAARLAIDSQRKTEKLLKKQQEYFERSERDRQRRDTYMEMERLLRD